MLSILLQLAFLSGAVSAQLVVPLARGDAPLQPFDCNQAPLLMDPAGPGPAMPPSDPSQAPAVPPSRGSGGGVVLSDVMGRDRSINLFAGYVTTKARYLPG
jgi:paired amphipathic helix protein Sin3a